MVATDTIRFDPEMYTAALRFYGLPLNYRRTFTSLLKTQRGTNIPLLEKRTGKPLTMLVACHSPTASAHGKAVWVQINSPFANAALTREGHPKKARNEEIERLLNITLDFETPAYPRQAHMIGHRLAARLVAQGIATPGLPIEDSGGGCHLVLPIVPIQMTRETATHWNTAVAMVVKQYIKPTFNRLVKHLNTPIAFGGYDISRVLSIPGTWRPPHPDKPDAPFLRQGYLRRWLPPYCHEIYPLRIESARLTQLIQEAYHDLSRPHIWTRCLSASRTDAQNNRFQRSLLPAHWLTSYAARKPQNDRSALFQSLVNATYLKFGEEMVIALQDTIHHLSGEKYHGRLDEEIQRSLETAKTSLHLAPPQR